MEESTLKNGKPKIAFKSRLQEAEKVNNNRRLYSKPICESIVTQLTPKAHARSLLMEIDHPMFTPASANEAKAKQRAGIVEINNAGAVIRNITMSDNEIIAEIETLSGFKGPDLASLIVEDKVNIGFSLRALGSVLNEGGILKVQAPICPITFDVVSNPSHANARVLSFIPESDLSLFESSQTMLLEGEGCMEEYQLIESEDNISIGDNRANIQAWIDNILAEHISAKLMNVKFEI